MVKVSETATRGGEPGAASGTESPHGVGPLAGVRVLELGSLIAGPFAGRQLADFGAEVIKIEAPSRPDPMREWGRARVQGHTLWWSVQSRGKKCVTLDLKSPRGRELFLELCQEADVLLENFRPGTLENLGLAPEELWQVNPGLIIARVSGYGQTGPDAQKPGYASVAEARGGLRYLNGYPTRRLPARASRSGTVWRRSTHCKASCWPCTGGMRGAEQARSWTCPS